MITKTSASPKSLLLDKTALQQQMRELNARMGIVPLPDVTPEKVRTIMREEGICPEDNSFTCELLQMRYEEE